MIINKKNICIIMILFLCNIMNTMISNQIKDNSNKIIKRYYRNIPLYKLSNKYLQPQHRQTKKHKNSVTKNQYKLNEYAQDLNNYYSHNKNRDADNPGFQQKKQTDYDTQREEFNGKSNRHSSQQQKNLKLYITGFAIGITAILDIVYNNLNQPAGEKNQNNIVEIIGNFLVEDEKNNFNIQFQNLTGMFFSEYQKLFLDPMDISIKKFVHIILYERSIGNSIQDTIFSFIEELKKTENKQNFIKLFGPLVQTAVKNECLNLYDTFGLINPLSRNVAESFYEYLISEQGATHIKQICNSLEKDITSVEKVAYVTTHVLAGTAFSILVNNVIISSVIKRGSLRTFLLTPTPFIPVALGLELYKINPAFVSNLASKFSSFIVKHQGPLFKFYNYYQLDNLDPSQSITYEDLPLNTLLDIYQDTQQKIQYNIDNVYVPWGKEIKNQVLSKKSNPRRFLESIKDKFLGN